MKNARGVWGSSLSGSGWGTGPLSALRGSLEWMKGDRYDGKFWLKDLSRRQQAGYIYGVDW